MPKYINADILNAQIYEEYDPSDNDDIHIGIGIVQYLLNEMPAADVVEVKHGEWIRIRGDKWACSECGNVIIFTERNWEKPYERGMCFCNKCGADMRGDKK